LKKLFQKNSFLDHEFSVENNELFKGGVLTNSSGAFDIHYHQCLGITFFMHVLWRESQPVPKIHKYSTVWNLYEHGFY